MPEMHSTHGTIWALFGHRLALEGPDGRLLVDLGHNIKTPHHTVSLARKTQGDN